MYFQCRSSCCVSTRANIHRTRDLSRVDTSISKNCIAAYSNRLNGKTFNLDNAEMHNQVIGAKELAIHRRYVCVCVLYY